MALNLHKASISQSTAFVPTSPTPTSASTTASSPIYSRDLELPQEVDKTEAAVDPSSADFVSRVSSLPIVNSALKVYEHSKKHSKVVNVRALYSSFSPTKCLK